MNWVPVIAGYVRSPFQAAQGELVDVRPDELCGCSKLAITR